MESNFNLNDEKYNDTSQGKEDSKLYLRYLNSIKGKVRSHPSFGKETCLQNLVEDIRGKASDVTTHLQSLNSKISSDDMHKQMYGKKDVPTGDYSTAELAYQSLINVKYIMQQAKLSRKQIKAFGTAHFRFSKGGMVYHNCMWTKEEEKSFNLAPEPELLNIWVKIYQKRFIASELDLEVLQMVKYFEKFVLGTLSKIEYDRAVESLFANPKLANSTWARTLVFKCAGSPTAISESLKNAGKQLATVEEGILRSYLTADYCKPTGGKTLNKTFNKTGKQFDKKKLFIKRCSQCKFTKGKHHPKCAEKPVNKN